MINQFIKVLNFCLILLFILSSKLFSQNPNWTSPKGSEFAHTASVIALVQLSDVTSNNSEDAVAFFQENEVRGKGQVISIGNGAYLHFVTMYSNQAIDTFKIKVYHQATNQVYEVRQPFIFRSQSITGKISDPYKIKIYPDNNAPISLLQVPNQFTILGIPFTNIDMNNYLVQPDGLPVDWTFTPHPNLNASFNGSILNVSGIPGFVGQASLTIKATEQSSAALEFREDESSSRTNNNQTQTAETTIIFNVNASYDPPLWSPSIPSQGIIKGYTFDSIALHAYENQFAGPNILYDYLPILEEKIPNDAIPSWQLNANQSTNMSLIAQLNFTPKYQFNHQDDVLAAFINNEVRGIAYRNSVNGLYYLTIGAEANEEDAVTLKFYSGVMKKVFTIENAYDFQAYKIHGSGSSPIQIEFSPIVPNIPSGLIPNGIATIPVFVTDTSFIGSQTFTFIAKDPAYPQILKDETNVSFCITADSTFLTRYYQDADGDGLGNAMASITACNSILGYVLNDDDCDDNNPLNNPPNILLVENAQIANDGEVCASTISLLSIDQVAQHYSWNNGDTTKIIAVSPDITTEYIVTITYSTGCVIIRKDTLNVEGKVIVQKWNSGFGSLRNVLECANENDTIKFDPLIVSSLITNSLIINKSVNIINELNTNPIIRLNFAQSQTGIVLQTNKVLSLKNIDIVVKQNVISTFGGTGKIDIYGSVVIRN